MQCHRPGGADTDHANTANTFATDFIEVVDDRQQLADALAKQRLPNVRGHVADPVRVAVVFGVATLVTCFAEAAQIHGKHRCRLVHQFPDRAVDMGGAPHAAAVGINDHIQRLAGVTGRPKEQGRYRHVAGALKREFVDTRPVGLGLATTLHPGLREVLGQADQFAHLRQRLGTSRDQAAFQDYVHQLNNTLLGYGITSVQDAGPDNGLERWQIFQELQSSGALQCRVTMFAGASHLEEFQSAGLTWGAGDDQLRLGHAKIMLTLSTGALEPNLAALTELVDNAHRAGFPVAIHAIEQEAIESAIKALTNAAPLASPEPTSDIQCLDRIEHCAECPPELVAEIARSGCMVVTQPGFVYWNGDNYLKRVDASMLPNLYPVGALANAGVPLAFGSDAPVIDPNPWPAIYNAVTRKTSTSSLLPPEASQQQAISVAEALRMYTAAGAIADGTGDQKGTIRPGMMADMVLLDTDSMTVEPEQLKEIGAMTTILGGEGVWEGGG